MKGLKHKERIQYNIFNFNQKLLYLINQPELNFEDRRSKDGKKVKIGKLDFTDLFLLKWFNDFKSSGKMTIIINQKDSKEYYWIKYEYIQECIPFGEFSKQTLYNRFTKLTCRGLLQHYCHKGKMPNGLNGTFSCYRVNEILFNLLINRDEEQEEILGIKGFNDIVLDPHKKFYNPTFIKNFITPLINFLLTNTNLLSNPLIKTTSINRSSYSSNELDSSCLKIIQHINSLNVFNRIKLPSDYKNNKVTKKLLTLIKYLQSLKSGTFLKIVNIDSKWRKENNIKIEPIPSLERTINKIINKYKQMLNDKDIWPSNKKILTKDLLEFFYNPESKRSYLLYCLCNDIKYIDKVLKTTIGNKIKNSLPAEVQKAGDILFKDGFDLKSFWFNIKQVYEWYVKNKDGLKEHNDKIHENCGYAFLTHAGKIHLFFNEYILCLKNKIGEYSIGNIGINKTFDKWFIPYCWDRDDPFALDFTERKNPYEQYEETAEDLYDFGEIEAVI